MRRLVLCLAICVGVLAAATSASALTKVLKQGVDGYTRCSDTYIDVDSPASNFGGLWYMHLYMRGHHPERSIPIRFDLSGVIPSGSVIQSATLSVWLYQVVDMTSGDWLEVGPYRLRDYRDWVESQATWNVFKGTTYWSTAGCENTSWDRLSSPDSYLYFYNTSTVNTYYNWNVTASVQAWIAGAQNHGWLLRAVEHDGGNEGLSFNAKESAEAYRPYLTIVYEAPSSAERATWGGIKALYR